MLVDGTSAYLSEDNVAYVFTTPLESIPGLPEAAVLVVGKRIRLSGKPFTVTSNQLVQLISAQGELPRLPELGREFAMVELRSEGTGAIGRTDAEVFSIDYNTQPPSPSIGGAVTLEDLQLTGLRDESAKDEKGRQFECPNCGASIAVTLATSKSIKLYTNSFYALLDQRLSASGYAVIQTTSPLVARQSFWTVVQTIESVGFTATPYHANVPSFGEWGFIIASRRPYRLPTALPGATPS